LQKSYDQATKILLGTIKEIMHDSHYTYISSVDHKYTELKEPGREMIADTVALLLPMLARAEHEQRQQDAENLMMQKLSK
jgi:hypothetical protein